MFAIPARLEPTSPATNDMMLCVELLAMGRQGMQLGQVATFRMSCNKSTGRSETWSTIEYKCSAMLRIIHTRNSDAPGSNNIGGEPLYGKHNTATVKCCLMMLPCMCQQSCGLHEHSRPSRWVKCSKSRSQLKMPCTPNCTNHSSHHTIMVTSFAGMRCLRFGCSNLGAASQGVATWGSRSCG